MALHLVRIDGCPLQEDNLSFPLKSWLAVLADTINSSFDEIEAAFKFLTAFSFSAADITAMAASLPNGILLYDTDNNVYVGKQSGALVKFTTTAYP